MLVIWNVIEAIKFDIYGEVDLNYLQVEHSTTWANDFMSSSVVAKYLSKGQSIAFP
jgi:hypothetical protein